MDRQVYISHSSRDRGAAEAICGRFEAGGVRCWMQPRDVLPGQDYALSIMDAIDHSRLMLVVLSRDASKSGHVIREINRAVDKRVPILPVKVDGSVLSPMINYYLGKTYWFDASRPPFKAHLDDLVTLVQRLLAGQTVTIPMSAAQHDPSQPADLEGQHVAAIRLRSKVETEDYDVFMCHNSKDKRRVIAMAEQLKKRSILPWLDIWEVRPGTRWQKQLEKNIKTIKSAAVFIGPKGAGPWQELEMEVLLQQLAKRRRPIIPVILEGRQGRPRLPAFLGMWHMIDMRQPDPDPFELLVWGITGQRPTPIQRGSASDRQG